MNRFHFIPSITILSIIILFSFACNNNSEPEPEPTPPPGFKDMQVSSSFTFESTNTINVQLEVVTNNPKEPPSKFYIYNGDPSTDGKLINSGITNFRQYYQTVISIPSYLEKVYVTRQDINNQYETVNISITGNTIHHSFQAQQKAQYKSTDNDYIHDDPGCTSCDHSLSGNYQNLDIDGSFCVEQGSNVTIQNLKFRGGTLTICGNATITNITDQGNEGGNLIVSGNGTLTLTNLSANHLTTFYNFGTVNISNNLNFKSDMTFENQGNFNVSGGVNNSSEQFINTENFNCGGNFTNDGVVANLGRMEVAGNFNNNGNQNTFVYNYCHLKINGNFNQNSKLTNYSYILVTQDINLNGSSETNLEPGSLITTDKIQVNSTINGPDVSCTKIDIITLGQINGSGNITGYVDLCTVDGQINNNGTLGPDVTFDCACYIPESSCNPGSGTDPGDGDGDGCPDDQDDYPDDSTRCSNEYYPNEFDFASFAYEDLWNSWGDYDFNDLVVEFNYKIVKNGKNRIVEIYGLYHIGAVGANLNNGFGVEFDVPVSAVESVTGYKTNGSAVSYNSNGTEAGPLDKSVVMVYDAINDYLGTAMVNTIQGGNSMVIDTVEVYMKFVNPQNSIGLAPYNPFIFIGQDRGHEIHAINKAPTPMANSSFFGQNADDSKPGEGRYYVSSTNLPWAIEIPETFDWPIETADITTAHLHFRTWAESSGAQYPDWYKNKDGYRDVSKIYNKE